MCWCMKKDHNRTISLNILTGVNRFKYIIINIANCHIVIDKLVLCTNYTTTLRRNKTRYIFIRLLKIYCAGYEKSSIIQFCGRFPLDQDRIFLLNSSETDEFDSGLDNLREQKQENQQEPGSDQDSAQGGENNQNAEQARRLLRDERQAAGRLCACSSTPDPSGNTERHPETRQIVSEAHDKHRTTVFLLVRNITASYEF